MAGVAQSGIGRRGPVVNTFSIVARDLETGEMGVAVASKFLAAGAVVPWLAAEVGAMAVQAFPDLTYGPRGLAMMREGLSAGETLDRLLAADPERDVRQVGVVDRHGGVAAHSGKACIDWAGCRTGEGYSCQGNILTGPETVDAMAEAFERTAGALPARLLAALLAGDAAGGDRRGRQSAGLVVVKTGGGYLGTSDTAVDLRVDDAPDPCQELHRLLGLHDFYFGSSPPANKLKIAGELAGEIQDILARAGYDAGKRRGEMDAADLAALEDLVATENLEERVDLKGLTLDPPALDFLRQKFAAAGD